MELINPNATERTRSLYRLLRAEEGKRILLAQQECPRTQYAGREIDWIEAASGELPAIRGMDFIHDDYDGVTERAREWNDRGGIVTVCWHTGIEGNDYRASQSETPDWDRLLTAGTAEFDMLIRRWDRAAEALLQLQREDIPVLWRPFHEFDGQWFWWGKGGGEPFIRLWRLMVNRFTRECGLNNLIWVLGYADNVRDGWDPGAAFFDIAGSDTYRGETVHGASYKKLKQMYPEKPAAFHECGLVPAAGDFFDAGCPWLWLMPWHSRWLMDNHPARIAEVYRDERTVTLRRLGAF